MRKRVDFFRKCERGMKKAVIEVRLVDEAQTESNETIKREHQAWCKEIEKGKITEP